MTAKSYIWLLALFFATGTITGHDMWIEPTVFSPDSGKIVGLRLRVGDNFSGSAIPHVSSLINEFVTVDATGRRPVVGREGADPAGLIRIATPGLTIAGYRSNPSPVTLTADKFNQYLKEEGLDAIAMVRAQRNQTQSDAREVFMRCAKSLILAGKPTEESDRPIGLPLELVALKNPYALHAGDEMPVRLTYDGRPVAGALVVAMNRLNPAEKISGRSAADGRVTLRLSQAGMWMIKAVHMVPAPPAANADWASFWASLTFEIQ